MRLVGERTITDKQIKAAVAGMLDGKTSKGACIRELFAGGLSVKEVSDITGIKYNHVYNVTKNEVLVHHLDVESSERNNEHSKKNTIIGLLQEGKTITQVAGETSSLYNYVWQIAKAEGLTKKAIAEASVTTEEQETVASIMGDVVNE